MNVEHPVDAAWRYCPYCGRHMEIPSVEREYAPVQRTTVHLRCSKCDVDIFHAWSRNEWPVKLNERQMPEKTEPAATT